MTKNFFINDYYNKYYLFSLHELLNKTNCSWSFYNLTKNTRAINETNLDFKDFNNNVYLKEYAENKIGLCEDILQNGMFFPFFITDQSTEQELHVMLGKHRLYSFLNYIKQNPDSPIEKKFLFITIPEKINIKDDFYFYCYSQPKALTILSFFGEDNRKNLYNQIFLNLDLTGGVLSSSALKKEIIPNPILQDETLFKQFIESPLNENNILFDYCKNIPKLKRVPKN